MAANTAPLDKTLKERADRRKGIPVPQREIEALEGIHDELTKLNAVVAVIASMRR